MEETTRLKIEPLMFEIDAKETGIGSSIKVDGVVLPNIRSARFSLSVDDLTVLELEHTMIHAKVVGTAYVTETALCGKCLGQGDVVTEEPGVIEVTETGEEPRKYVQGEATRKDCLQCCGTGSVTIVRQREGHDGQT